MKCDNCGKNNANVKYFKNINGVKTQMNLCEECCHKLGITSEMEFNMPIDFSSFLGGFFEDISDTGLMSLIENPKKLECDGCNSTFQDIIKTGKFGCPMCYETFETEIDSLLNKLHGSNRHIGRIGDTKKRNVIEKNENKTNKKAEKIEELKNKLKELVAEENYEEAAKVRDEIKKIEN